MICKRVTIIIILFSFMVGMSVHHFMVMDKMKIATDVIARGEAVIAQKDRLVHGNAVMDEYIAVRVADGVSNQLEALLKGEVSQELEKRCKEAVRRARKPTKEKRGTPF